MNNFQNQVVIVTGAGAGIGRALALGFVRCGAQVIAIGRSMQGLVETQNLCSDPKMLSCHEIDVANADALVSLFADIMRTRGRIDILINNAAVYPRVQLQDTTPTEWEKGVATNLNGVVFGCLAAIRTIPAARPALIINVGTFAYLGPLPASTLYCSTKAAVAAFTSALAVELEATNSSLIVNEWNPGEYQTKMSNFTGASPDSAFEHLVKVIHMSWGGKGGRVFALGNEIFPPISRLAKIKNFILGRKPK